MNTFLGELATFNDIQYARYRLAFKLRKLQKTFLFDEVEMSTLQEGLHLSSVEPLPRSAVIPVSQLITTIQELYSSLRLHRPMLKSVHIQQAQELCTNWLQMNYQCATGGKIQVGSLKITLCLLTGAKEADKARHMFSVLANSNGSVEPADIAYFCKITQHLAGTLQEDVFANWEGPERFWKECLLSVRSADDIADEEIDCGGLKRQWLSQFEFIKVFSSTHHGPLFLSWWALYHRVKTLGKIIHNVRCSACTRKPMVSFRYQCTECSNFNLCQMCFLKGKLADAHKDSHQVLEIVTPSKSQKSWKHRLMGAGGQEGSIWDEPKSPFVFNPRSSVSSISSSDDYTDTSMNAISDMLASSQQQKSTISRHTHKPTLIRIGSQPIIRNPVITTPQQPATVTSHNQLKCGSLSTNSSESPDSVSSFGGKFCYEGVGASHSRTTSTSSCSDAPPPGMNADAGKPSHPAVAMVGQHRPRSQSNVATPSVEDELTEINKRLSMEVDMLLNDIALSTEEPSPPPAKLSVSPIGHHMRPRRGYSLQHLRLEEKALEKDVSTLTNKREELTEELETLMSQVQSLHTHSVSLSNGVRVAPAISISPLVGPIHSRSDSLPTEAYSGNQSSLRQSPSSSPIPRLSPVPSQTSTGRGHSPLINRRRSPAPQLAPTGVSPVYYQQQDPISPGTASPVNYHQHGHRGLYSSQEQISERASDLMSDQNRPLSANYQLQPHQMLITEL